MRKVIKRQSLLVGTPRCGVRSAQRAAPTTFVLSLMLALLAGAGCVSQKKARDEQRRAYLAGQQQAMMQAPQRPRQEQGPVVFMQGPVRNPVVPWQEGLTLSQAIVQADYTAFMNPLLVRVIRNGQIVAECKGIDLLHHQDMELADGDTVLLVP